MGYVRLSILLFFFPPNTFEYLSLYIQSIKKIDRYIKIHNIPGGKL
jgi:hypothetical protein